MMVGNYCIIALNSCTNKKKTFIFTHVVKLETVLLLLRGGGGRLRCGARCRTPRRRRGQHGLRFWNRHFFSFATVNKLYHFFFLNC